MRRRDYTAMAWGVWKRYPLGLRLEVWDRGLIEDLRVLVRFWVWKYSGLPAKEFFRTIDKEIYHFLREEGFHKVRLDGAVRWRRIDSSLAEWKQ